ncbi:MAG: glutathione peroxidase [Pyrinomonadaceae bacterium]
MNQRRKWAFRVLWTALVLVALGGVGIFAFAYKNGMVLNPSPDKPPKERSMYEFSMKDIDGRIVPLESYKGKVAMIVNTASRCGLTPQYEGLEALYVRYNEKGFVVLGFPANNFLGQEPGTDNEIKEFCTLKYDVTFPMFSKISVKGRDQHPFYTYLTHKETNPEFAGDIGWNFEKFLINRNGKIIGRFSPSTTPDDPVIVKAVESALAEAES